MVSLRFACIVLAGTSEGIAGPRVLRELVVGVAAPSDLIRSIIVEILHSGEGGDVEQVLEPRNNSPVFAIARLSLTCVYTLHAYIVHIYYMLDIYLFFIVIFAWDFLLTLVFNQKSHSGTLTLSLEKS